MLEDTGNGSILEIPSLPNKSNYMIPFLGLLPVSCRRLDFSIIFGRRTNSEEFVKGLCCCDGYCIIREFSWNEKSCILYIWHRLVKVFWKCYFYITQDYWTSPLQMSGKMAGTWYLKLINGTYFYSSNSQLAVGTSSRPSTFFMYIHSRLLIFRF
jgi:hypothetical protein